MTTEFVDVVAVLSMPGILVVAIGPVLLGAMMASAWAVGLAWPADRPGAAKERVTQDGGRAAA